MCSLKLSARYGAEQKPGIVWTHPGGLTVHVTAPKTVEGNSAKRDNLKLVSVEVGKDAATLQAKAKAAWSRRHHCWIHRYCEIHGERSEA